MDELIWVGNTLYPRWFVIAVPAAVFLTGLLLVGIASRRRRISMTTEGSK